jgi:hypothetical protein
MNHPIPKKPLLDQVISLCQSELDLLRSGIAAQAAGKQESATRMQSRYDTFGVESSWMADGLSRNWLERVHALALLQALKLPVSPAAAAAGCVVGLGPAGGSGVDYYFLLPAAGGLTLKLPDSSVEVATLALKAPLARKIFGKKLGDLIPAASGISLTLRQLD